MALDLTALYREYLVRFDREVGAIQVGQFAKYQGKLIQKLARPDFDELFAEYHELAQHYYESIDRGDTINDVAVKLLREKAAQLILKPPGG